MLYEAIVCYYEHQRYVQQQLSELHSIAALVRRSHKDDAISRRLNGAMFFERVLSGCIRMDESLVGQLGTKETEGKADTLDDNTSKAVCNKDDWPSHRLPGLAQLFDASSA